MCLGATGAGAQSAERPVPGYFRVPVVAAMPRGAQLTGALGYGFTESQVAASGGHHRMKGRLAASLTPLRGLDFGLGANLRHDEHTSSEQGGHDEGTVLSSDLSARIGDQLGRDLHLGLGVAAAFAGGVSAARSLENPALDVQLLAALLPDEQPWSLRALAGFRYDRTASAVLAPREYRAGDRLALGLSEFNAVPLGIAAGYRWGRMEWIAELSADILVGEGAPSVAHSPARVGGGARHALSESLALTWLTEAVLSARPATGSNDPLLPIEPRLQVLVGIAYTLVDGERAAPVALVAPVVQPPPALAALPPAPATSILVNVTASDGYPLSDATVELQLGEHSLTIPHRNLESYVLAEPPSGEATLRVSAPRLKPQTRSIRLESGAPLVVDVQLEAAPPSGQLRGLVRSFGGQGLRARIRVEPIGVELSSDEKGAFLIDVAPGRYDVTIDAPGHASQRKRVDVRPEGVVILNADLSKAAP
jgi:hypothetical protein